MKGIILAGGIGSRLAPLTRCISKHLLPIYDKPMIYYALSLLMLLEIRDILFILTKQDLAHYQRIFGDGTRLGIKIAYAIQENPSGIAEALIIGTSFIGDDSCALILGDNIFYGDNLCNIINQAKNSVLSGKACIFGCRVSDPRHFGVVEFDNELNILSLNEKPENPKSSYAITGLYFFPPGVCDIAKSLNYSSRGELEITDLNNIYREKGRLELKLLTDCEKWFDAGTPDGLLEASLFIKNIQHSIKRIVASPEEISYLKEWIGDDELMNAIKLHNNSLYGKYLEQISIL